MSVSQGENSAVRSGPGRALLVQHQTACLCLSIGTSSLWTTISLNTTVSSGRSNTSDFSGIDGSRVGTDLFWGIRQGLVGQRIKAYVCLHLRGTAAAAEAKEWQLLGALRPGHWLYICTGPTQCTMGNWIIHQQKWFHIEILMCIPQQNGIQCPTAIELCVTSSYVFKISQLFQYSVQHILKGTLTIVCHLSRVTWEVT